MSEPPHFDAIVIGGGAAGLMCASQIGAHGRRVLLLEHNDRVGKKIFISGGGRCNFTNIGAKPANFLSSNPRFCTSALTRYTPQDFIGWIESHGIAYHEKKLGQLFCDDSAQQIIDALLSDCRSANVDIRTACTVRSVDKDDRFSVDTSLGLFTGDALIIATGGLSIPKLGASSLGYRIAEQFDIPVIPTRPGLVPLTLAEDDLEALGDLAGVAFDAKVTVNKITFEEAVLVTHRGLSGPAILQVSSYRADGDPVTIDSLPHLDPEGELLRLKNAEPKSVPFGFLNRHFSRRFAQRLCEHHGWIKPLGETSDKDLRKMAEQLRRWTIPVSGTEGYAKAEVTCGGVDTRALSPKTMEAKNAPGLYFIGEVVDVTGWLGGYNFQWAWSSAHAAATAIGEPDFFG